MQRTRFSKFNHACDLSLQVQNMASKGADRVDCYITMQMITQKVVSTAVVFKTLKMTFSKAFNRGRVVHGQEARYWITNNHLKIDKVSEQCFLLFSIYRALNQLTADVFSLDVDGDEMRVLQSILFD
ncbi:hypothetical protein MAR_030687 [Mya arenaria]|uniref:Methyltransferase FkbM domain-containing protein n=1 Tax=Mya arenaria TaxID=6604 RepID=A0ABY7F1M6_MYAAR|nr:hypothetical protein MAR_030687 [Mya arenaria]